jgi:uncharacterized membrane protein YidH (DUF202 family)
MCQDHRKRSPAYRRRCNSEGSIATGRIAPGTWITSKHGLFFWSDREEEEETSKRRQTGPSIRILELLTAVVVVVVAVVVVSLFTRASKSCGQNIAKDGERKWSPRR